MGATSASCGRSRQRHAISARTGDGAAKKIFPSWENRRVRWGIIAEEYCSKWTQGYNLEVIKAVELPDRGLSHHREVYFHHTAEGRVRVGEAVSAPANQKKGRVVANGRRSGVYKGHVQGD